MRRPTLPAILLLLTLAPIPGAALTLTDVSVEAGVDVVHDSRGFWNAGQELQNMYGPGVAWADVNYDRWLDLVVGNGQSGNFLFLNNGDGTFTNVAGDYNIHESRGTNGVALADINNDGLLDLAMVNFWREPQFFRGGRTTMSEVAELLGLNPLLYDPVNPPPEPIEPESMGVSFGDFDQDGWVDMYVANYTRQPDVLMKNIGGGFFERTGAVEVTLEGFGFTGVFWDFDNDADQDIYVVNDFGYNFLFENQGREWDWEFVDKAAIYKVSGGGPMQPKSMGMGAAAGDYDNDLDLDLYITNYWLNALYENLGPQVNDIWRFRERAEEAGVEFDLNCWGVDFCDLDLDGDLDLIQASGFIASKMIPQQMDIPNKVWLNNGAPNWDFTDVSEASGFDDRGMGRGLATADYDRDGDLDVVVTNNTYYDPAPDQPHVLYPGQLLLYRNDQQTGHHWSNLTLEGGGIHGSDSGCNRYAVGARVYLTAGGVTQMREIQAGSSYLSQNSLEVEFGLGTSTVIDEVRVRWVCGDEEIFAGVEVDRFYRLVEGQSTAVPLPVALMRFDAFPWSGGIRLEWTTGPGVEVVETRVYRAPREDPDRLAPIVVSTEYLDGRMIAFDGSVEPGRSYAYRLVLTGRDGIAVSSGLVFATAGEVSIPRPQVGQNYPNPFNPSTVILFELPERMPIRLVLHDAKGRLVRTLLSEVRSAGPQRIEWDGRDEGGTPVASGVYTYTLISEKGTSSRRMTLVR